MKMTPITTLFLDVGGVLPTNGWDHRARRRAAKHFNRLPGRVSPHGKTNPARAV